MFGKAHTNVTPQDVLQLLLLEATLDDQALASVDGTRSSQLRKQERSDVLLASLHLLADFADVDEDTLPVTFTHNLGRRDLVRLQAAITSELRVVSAEKGEEAVQEERVGKGGVGGLVPDTRASDGVAGLFGSEVLRGGGRVVTLGDTSLGKLRVKVGGGLLLLLFLGEVELALAFRAVLLLGLLLLLGRLELFVAGVGGGLAVFSGGWQSMY